MCNFTYMWFKPDSKLWVRSRYAHGTHTLREHTLYLNAPARDRTVPGQWSAVWTDRPAVGRNVTVRPCSDIQEFCSLPTQRIMSSSSSSSLSSPHLYVVTLYARLPALTLWIRLQSTAFTSGCTKSIGPPDRYTNITTQCCSQTASSSHTAVCSLRGTDWISTHASL